MEPTRDGARLAMEISEYPSSFRMDASRRRSLRNAARDIPARGLHSCPDKSSAAKARMSITFRAPRKASTPTTLRLLRLSPRQSEASSLHTHDCGDGNHRHDSGRGL